MYTTAGWSGYFAATSLKRSRNVSAVSNWTGPGLNPSTSASWLSDEKARSPVVSALSIDAIQAVRLSANCLRKPSEYLSALYRTAILSAVRQKTASALSGRSAVLSEDGLHMRMERSISNSASSSSKPQDEYLHAPSACCRTLSNSSVNGVSGVHSKKTGCSGASPENEEKQAFVSPVHTDNVRPKAVSKRMSSVQPKRLLTDFNCLSVSPVVNSASLQALSFTSSMSGISRDSSCDAGAKVSMNHLRLWSLETFFSDLVLIVCGFLIPKFSFFLWE